MFIPRMTALHLWIGLAGLAVAQPLVPVPPESESPAAIRLIEGKPALHVALTDGSKLQVALLDEMLELVTPYGALKIPVRDVRRIEFMHRLAPEDEVKLSTALDELGSKDFKTRQRATDTLFEFREKALPTLHKAAKSADAEVVKRAEALLNRFKELLGEENCLVRTSDVVYTADSKIAGRLSTAGVRVKTTAFGVQSLNLVNVKSMSFPGHEVDSPISAALPDPGNLNQYANDVGRTMIFRVTGTTRRQGSIYGTGTYTSDSMLALAAVHAGILKDGQTGFVKVTIVGQHPSFDGTARNGISSSSYGSHPGYKVSKVVRD